MKLHEIDLSEVDIDKALADYDWDTYYKRVSQQTLGLVTP